MAVPSDNETWLIHAGDAVIQKRATEDLDSLGPWERLVYCLWAADYGMRNAGGLDAARAVYADFQSDAASEVTPLAFRVSLPTPRTPYRCWCLVSAERRPEPSGHQTHPTDQQDSRDPQLVLAWSTHGCIDEQPAAQRKERHDDE
jgi:hypothetical protein